MPVAMFDTAETTADIADTKAYGRSAMTNGSTLLPGVDGRSIWARRFRDLLSGHINDLGGDDVVSEAERSIARRATALEVELERLELRFATAGEAEAADLDLYSRASNTMRRHFEALGLERRQRDVTPDLGSYIRRKEVA